VLIRPLCYCLQQRFIVKKSQKPVATAVAGPSHTGPLSDYEMDIALNDGIAHSSDDLWAGCDTFPDEVLRNLDLDAPEGRDAEHTNTNKGKSPVYPCIACI
jgi:hypothetical protein